MHLNLPRQTAAFHFRPLSRSWSCLLCLLTNSFRGPSSRDYTNPVPNVVPSCCCFAITATRFLPWPLFFLQLVLTLLCAFQNTASILLLVDLFFPGRASMSSQLSTHASKLSCNSTSVPVSTSVWLFHSSGCVNKSSSLF